MTLHPPQFGPDLGVEAPDFAALDLIGTNGYSVTVSAMQFLNEYAYIFVAAFLVTLLATPVIRRLAVRWKVVDHPVEQHKTHRQPVAYLGGLAVFLGLIVAIVLSWFHYSPSADVGPLYRSIPLAVVIGMIAITFTGLADDVWGWDPRLKIAGQLVAAAALAVNDVGVNVATGILRPFLGSPLESFISIGAISIPNADLYYWIGTALIAVFVLGGCNAANLIDGLDGLLSGVVGITAVGLLAISLLMATQFTVGAPVPEETLGAARIVLCIALLGAVLGFLPHNFNPAVIFLGDCGSLLMGYMVVVIILMLGEMGQTHLVFAGLIVFAIPIIDTTLAIIRRRLAGIPMSAADDQHLHHQVHRALGSVRRAVLSLYALSAVFAIVGVSLAALVMRTGLSVRIIYALALVLFGFVAALAVKVARRQQLMLADRHGGAAAETAAKRESAPEVSSPVTGGGDAPPADESTAAGAPKQSAS